MQRHRQLIPILALAWLASLALPSTLLALEECRLMRQPDIAGDRIVFSYGGDLWSVARSGGAAVRLTTHDGLERFPKLSPDGRTVAFTAQYDGNQDAYTMPVEGGEPKRLTWHPMPDQVAEWYPDGKAILLRSIRASSIPRFDRFFKVPAEGGFEEMLALPTAGYAALSSDGAMIAFVSPSYDNRTWKRYKGGNSPNIWIYNFAKNTSEMITDWAGADEWPMWRGRTLYYSSDRDSRTANLWAYDLDKKTHRQVTKFTEYDVKWPSIGGDSIVFENGGYLHVLDLNGEKSTQIRILVPDDKPHTRSDYRNVAAWTQSWEVSPSAKRAVLEARGDIFTVPAEKGDVRNLTQSPGSRERRPVWSPDGKWIAYFSDKSGEYEIHVIGSDGKTADRQVTKGGGLYRFTPLWSPDSSKIAFSDKSGAIYYCPVEDGKITKVDKSERGDINDYQWSSDSKWLVYSVNGESNINRIRLYSLDDGKVTEVSDGMTNDYSPSFDPEGKYIYFISSRTLRPNFGAFEFNYQFTATDRIYAMSLRPDVGSPVPPESDEEEGDKKDGDKDKKEGDKKGDEKSASAEEKGGEAGKEAEKGSGKDGDKDGDKDDKKKEPEPIKIELAGLGSRVSVLPIPAGQYGQLTASKGKLFFAETEEQVIGDDDGPGGGPGLTIHMFDLKDRKDKKIISGVRQGYALSKDGGKVMYRSRDAFGIVEAKENQKSGDGKIPAGTLMATVDPRQEWMQIFNEAWRLERDFYYDPGMGGLDWKAIGDRYRQLVPYVAHRADLNYILGEMQGELATSHAYGGFGGDQPQVDNVPVGLLGADYDLDTRSGLYRFKTIYRDTDWNSRLMAPLAEPGIEVKEGDYLLSVNNQPVKAPKNIYEAFVGTAGKQTTITVGSTPDDPNARTYTVKPLDNEFSVRYTVWVNDNREKVYKATNGRVAYIHVPNTSIAGIQEFTKQYYPQVDKDAIIVDERFNGGGFIPDFFVERLARKTWTRWSTRDGDGFRTSGTAIDGPKCILINEYAGSGGDAFPYYFRLAGLGPLIGKRTWGGLVGISRQIPLVDGGGITMPDFGMYDPIKGEWLVENHGVDPDIEVENAPHLLVSGQDPQLDKAIEYISEQLKKSPPPKHIRPKYKVQGGQ